jgi:hypothetical protein
MSKNIFKQLNLPYNYTKEQIDTAFENKVNSIIQSIELSKLDKKILLNEYYTMYKNSILVKNNKNNIGMIYPISNKNNNYTKISSYIDNITVPNQSLQINKIKINKNNLV